MWSRKFLIAGLLIGFVLAAVVLAGILLVVHAAGESEIARYGRVAIFGLGGVLVYPACWAIMIHKTRDYSARRTYFLIAATYTATAVLAIAVVLIGFTYQAVIMGSALILSPDLWRVTLFLPFMLFLVVVFGFLAAGLVAVPYAIVATPIAFLHRALMLRLFNPASDAASDRQENGPAMAGP